MYVCIIQEKIPVNIPRHTHTCKHSCTHARTHAHTHTRTHTQSSPVEVHNVLEDALEHLVKACNNLHVCFFEDFISLLNILTTK